MPFRILLVDDNAVNLKLTQALLAREGYQVATAISAEQALDNIAATNPHLVLTDVHLTGMDGLEMTRRFKSSAGGKAVPVIALTGLNAPDDERAALAAGCSAFLAKPYQSQELRNLVRRYLGAEPAAAAAGGVSEDVMAELREEFRAAGVGKCSQLLAMLPAAAPQRSIAQLFDYQELKKALHSWAGAGGTFGLPRITEKAREAESLLTLPFEQIALQLRGVMEDLLEQFTEAEPAATRTALPAAVVSAPPAGPRPEILICDDDPLVAAVIKSTLEEHGMLCRTAADGRIAFSMARNDPPDAVILDINMPALGGFQVLDELRRLQSTRQIKVMLLTGRYDTEDITRGLSLGADDYMAKPFDPAALVERVKGLLAAPPG